MASVKDGAIHWIPVELGVEGDVETEIIPKDGEVIDETTAIVAAPNEMYVEGMAVLSMAQ